ncbi:hypothetical protein DOTSEDRAFT_67575 [Dothistroma septosporum NZE10]|uniref:F-box domain-containing protein n=1 Tax=Dothistroma septosporum (strain NZE10 / CBS 128990) TaxID=675120 RepID=N1PYR0_DOTSN|nr:hypothetical protein DOTSEDRAFT_67575 [Dothistroma septosporum NZE10]
MNDQDTSRPPLPRGLPVELFKLILSYIEPNHEQALPIDKAIASRQFLSVESLEPPDPSHGSVRDSLSTIGNFRLSCKVFEQIGAPFLFTRVATRFSKDGLRKLERLSHWRHLARHVKRFTYLVPYFVKGELSDFDTLQAQLRQGGVQAVDSLALRDKIREQRTTIALKEDARILKKAIASFTSLQLVQILRVTNREDAMLSEYLRRHEEARRVINLDWSSACSHAARTVGTALLDSSNMEWNRFSLPMLSPTSAQFLKLSGPNSVQMLAERLSCLTLHFDDSEDLEAKLQDLSDLFRSVFSKAKKMRAIHIGFPSHRPINLPLESIFHFVQWDDLVAFGVNGWELEDVEIIQFLKRHKGKLRGVRLRDVHLKDGSRWSNVLEAVKYAICSG